MKSRIPDCPVLTILLVVECAVLALVAWLA